MHRHVQDARARFKMGLLCGAAAAVIATQAMAADDRPVTFNIAAQDAGPALNEFSRQTGLAVLFPFDAVAGKRTPAITGTMDTDEALNKLLASTGLVLVSRSADTIALAQEGGSSPQSAGADVDALIVTAQKREENIQDVPIAISAFSQEDLTTRQVAGGPDLITQVPNMTFTKTNFSGYSIQIRGIGTQAISATTDAAVAVAMNNTPFIRNRFFEQEFYDLERIEVLRGPQGTLYGRNATAGAVNIITAKPKFYYEAKLSGDVANYNSTRMEGMINIPLVDDAVALRLAAAWTKREGFVTNEITGNPIDGRDLWSSRATLRFEPNDWISANLIWEHFQEDDDRLRSAKQLCHRDAREQIGGYKVPDLIGYSGLFHQGCLPSSMYAPEAFEAPNGFSLPYYHALGQIFLPVVPGLDPYASTTQSRDLRVIESTVDPKYSAQSDVAEFQINIDLSDTLTLTSETAYSADTLFSTQDYNRFNTASGAFADLASAVQRDGILTPGPNGNVFCDPQIGCADRLVAVDLSTAVSRQFSQELRLSSDFEGPFNFSLGANYLRYDTEDKYYVFINTVSLYSSLAMYAIGGGNFPGGVNPDYVPGVSDNMECLENGPLLPDLSVPQPVTACMYIDPNPIGALNDQGHNYFISRNPYKLISYAAFGEAYYDITDDLKLTAGLRVTADKKEAPRIPSWLLGGETVGYSVAEIIKLDWTEPTGRLTLDWKPNDDTMVYASYAHGYKAGGSNPPAAGVVAYGGKNRPDAVALVEQSASHPKTFAPEFVDAFEVGMKNTLLDGKLTLNTAAFFYDYEGYQISYIVNRSAVNLNFDAQVWGLELEADWKATDNLRLGFKGGYEKTKVADGMQAIDMMDRTDGHEDWIVVKPFPSYPSNCILPLATSAGAGNMLSKGPNAYQGGNPGPCEIAYILGLDPLTGLEYVPDPTVTADNYPLTSWFPGYKGFNPKTAPNNGEGFSKQLGGNELPNAPNWTGTLTMDFTLPLSDSWLATLHGDLHYQGESWARIFNTDGYDKIKAYTNVNFAALLTNEDAGWHIMAYVKNAFDKDSITGTFLNSDDSGLTTNVFLTEPRTFGLRVTKDWTGDSWLGRKFERREHVPGTPYPFQVEIGGSTDSFLADTAPFRPEFVDDYEPSLVFPLAVQNQDLDRGEQRDVKFTYMPSDEWRISATYRYGKVNGGGRAARYDQAEGGYMTSPYSPTTYVPGPNNYGISTVTDSEDHEIIDFTVGKDIGVGAFGEGDKSAVSVGLRYAKLSSRSTVEVFGTPDWYIPPVDETKYLSDTHTTHREHLKTERTFEGTGPVLSWDASRRLLGDVERGRVGLDWSLSGGVLFGTQKVKAKGHRKAEYYYHPPAKLALLVFDTLYNEPIDVYRTEEVTVPTFGASVGVSYEIDRVKVSGGYRWERYLDAIDGGYKETESFDRGFDGPYLKISVGFGQ